MALGWMNATASGRNPGLLFVGFVLVLASRRANADDLATAAGVLALPVLHWFYMEAWRLARGRTPTLVPAQERSLL